MIKKLNVFKFLYSTQIYVDFETANLTFFEVTSFLKSWNRQQIFQLDLLFLGKEKCRKAARMYKYLFWVLKSLLFLVFLKGKSLI